MTTIVDTNFLLALFDTNDPHYESAYEIAMNLEGMQVLLPVLVIAESLVQEDRAQERLHAIQCRWPDIVATTEEELVIMAEFPQEIRKKLKANDCLILAHCIAQDANLITFDENLKKAYEQI